jgi:hypothetical protein
MVDLSNPNPLIMTHFELIGFVGGLAAVAILAIRDVLSRRRSR